MIGIAGSFWSEVLFIRAGALESGKIVFLFHMGVKFFPVVAPTKDTRAGFHLVYFLYLGVFNMSCPGVLSSIGSSRLMFLSPLLHGEINFIDWERETAKPSWCHSYRSSFKRQVIALPSHGQNTAAVKLIVTGQAGPLIHLFARGDVFGKQARL